MEIKRRRYYSSSWLDLPQHLMEQILERLPFTDYIRFAGVCRSWEAIQKEHRRGHAHALSVPPTLAIPWLITVPSAEGGSDTRLCYSPFENNRLYSLQIPGLKDMCCLASSHGWLLLTPYPPRNFQSLQFMCTFVLLNPISGRKIKLPQLKLVSRRRPIIAAISCAPTDTKSCVIMIISMPRISLCRVGDPNWTVLYGCRDVSSMIPKTPAPIFCGGKFYCTSYYRELMVVVDPLPTPEVDIVEMDTGEIPPTDELNLVESNGEILSVVALTERRRRRMIKGFQVFKADLTKKMWVKVESLRDRLLIVGTDSLVSLAAEGSRAGNRIYFSLPTSSTEAAYLWKEFDLEAGKMIEEDEEAISKKKLQQIPCTILMVPNLDSCN